MGRLQVPAASARPGTPRPRPRLARPLAKLRWLEGRLPSEGWRWVRCAWERGSSGPSRRIMGPSGHLSCREMSSVAASLFSSVKWGSPALGRGGGALFGVGGWTGLLERRGWGGALWEEPLVGGERSGISR